MTFISDQPPSANLLALRNAASTLDAGLRAADAQLKADLAAKEAAKKQRSPLDDMEEKVMTTTAIAAAASGTPEQAKAMLASARSKVLQAAADGADTAALEAVVHQLEHLADVAEENREIKNHAPAGSGQDDSGAAAIPIIATIGLKSL